MNDLRALLNSLFPLVFVYYLNSWLEALFSVYERYPWFDIPMHVLGGLVSARALYLLYQLYKERLGIRLEPSWLVLLGLIGGVAIIAYVWEVYEQLWDMVYGTKYQQSTTDLLFDMCLGMAGAFLYWISAVAFTGVHKKKKK